MQNLLSAVEQQYKRHFYELDDRKFHLASRLFLWTRDSFAKGKLEELKKEYIGGNEDEYDQKIKEILRDAECSKKMLFRKIREPLFLKYPLLKTYNKVLFRNLFCKTLYGIELRDIIEKNIPTKNFLELKNLLENDPHAIAAFSTHAVNYFYTLDFYLDSPKDFISPEFFLKIAKEDKLFANNEFLSLKLYLLTHCIIGESAFYSREIKKGQDVYRDMLAILEDEISRNYEKISLDNKLEFLVCANMCKTPTNLFECISREVAVSFDGDKGCLVDSENAYSGRKNDLILAEHRNMLALMALFFDRKI